MTTPAELMTTIVSYTSQRESSQNLRELGKTCVFLMRAGDRKSDAALFAQQSGAPARVVDLLRKSTVAGGVMGDPHSWAAPFGELAILTNALLGSMARSSAFERLLPSMMPLVPKQRTIVATSVVTGDIVTEMSAKPVTQLNLESIGPLNTAKGICQLVLSDEILKFHPGAADLINGELKKGLSAAVDIEWLSIVTTGLSPETSAGESSSDFLSDVRTLLALLDVGATSRLVLILPALLCSQLAAKADSSGSVAFPTIGVNGGSIGNGSIEIVPSDGAQAGTLTLLDASGLGGWSGPVELAAGPDATLKMDTTPGDSTPDFNLFQRNCKGLKASRHFAATRLRDSAVATMTAGDYSSDGASG